MKIIFVWIETYKKLNNFQTSFSGKYKIKYHKNKLVISKNKLFVENFFKINGSDIDINLSAVVGENGTGKSTILDMIVEYIEQGMFFSDYIFIFESQGKIIIDSNFEINHIEITDENLEYRIINNDSLDTLFEKQVTIFFSNVFDVRYFDYDEEFRRSYGNNRFSDFPRFRNISTNSLLKSYRKPEDLLYQDFSSQIFFVNEYKSILEMEKLVKIPPKIYLRTHSLESEIENLAFELEHFIKEFENENVSGVHFNISIKGDFKEELITLLIQSFCLKIGYLLKKHRLDPDILIDTHHNAKTENNFFKMIHKNLVKEVKIYESNKNILKVIKTELNNIYNDYQSMLNYLIELNIRSDEMGDYLDSNSTESNTFINFYKNRFYSTNILSFYWSEMSSGQLSLLNLFGRFYNSLYEIQQDLIDEEFLPQKENVSLKEFEYLLLIDECDLYFHPQWQKDWLYYFLKLIEILFKGNVQVILTTHSPFVLSDFPNTNVTFLSNFSKPLTLSNEIEGSPRTFGANINELLTNSFFINDGLMGKFAKNKINSFIKDLMNTTPDDVLKNKSNLKTFIDLIGDPFIKNKLLQIYNEKLQLASDDEIEKRIKYLEKELDILKQRSDLN
ncbi:AAA family ATPase [Bacillus thuringiensis]|uniref:AAA family ATPase n=1 Tax=Bacillus cereus group TaxID=86661 RepID=UPI0012988C8F|nr:AAA family ATPase [Bacillus thuringiensis]MEB8859468.1 AAA family ATPase [Bacillus cereus]MDR5045727.1 AAA family ATPase [Bacillus thuringiensis]MEB9421401.1 AAA family ATPase [Bacillus cereus]MEC2469040.1 AAA family ATPase [Bacillus cereus]MRC85987.1 AAA family ATPase [Bacillus thuringiensis]